MLQWSESEQQSWVLDNTTEEGEHVVIIVYIIQLLAQILSFLVLVQVILSYFMSPYHPIRQKIDRIVEPFLSPIRRLIPPVGMFDFSPIILIFLIQIIVSLVSNLLLRI